MEKTWRPTLETLEHYSKKMEMKRKTTVMSEESVLEVI